MKKVKILGSERLFDKWKEVAGRINKVAHLVTIAASVVQNDMEVEIEDLREFKDKVIPNLLKELDDRKDDIKKLYDITINYIKKCNES